MTEPLIYLVAGEASGDALGAGLMRSASLQHPGVRFAGIGGEAMHRQGLESLFPYSDLSIMGFLEVVPHIPLILKRLRQTLLDIMIKQPSVIVTIDSPGFTFRLAAMLARHEQTRHILRIHYVAPSVWAYKPGRAEKTALLFDGLLTLLPFEPPYFEEEGLKASFVGHPVLWDTAPGDDPAFRRRHKIPANANLLLVLPGSRMGEVKRHVPIFLDAVRALPEYMPVILAGPQVKDYIERHAPATAIVCDSAEKADAFAAASLALSKSGTITLELAAAGVPTVVAHKVSALSAWLMRQMILIPYVSLINIAAKRLIQPELLQEHCNPAEITLALKTLSSQEAIALQRSGYGEAIKILKGDKMEHPSTLAAKAVLNALTQP
jgi:lipid-A-disaccharide synthase